MSLETRQRIPGPDLDSDPAIAEAADLLRAGQVVALPTETVYGLAGNAADRLAVDAIFKAKSRPADNPLIVHLADRHMLSAFCSKIPACVEKLAQAFWPGPLTLVLPAAAFLRDTVCRGLDTVAVRVPDHPIALAVIRRSGLGLAAPSANLSGRPSPTTADHVHHDMNGRIPLIIDGGPCRLGIESTVLDLSGEQPMILRPGSISAAAIASVLGIELQQSHSEAEKRSPGTRYTHYSPRAKVYLVGPSISAEAFAGLWTHLLQRDVRLGYLGTRALPSELDPRFIARVSPDDLARRLYQVLRAMDDLGATDLIIDGLEKTEIGLSLMDRLEKAASICFTRDAEIQQHLGALP